MPNIGIALAGGTLIGGVVFLLALWAYEEYQRSQRLERRQSHRENERRPQQVASGVAPPQPGTDCAICHDMLSSPLEILPCGHLFHRQCIKKWFERRMVCPVCRTRITEELTREYVQRLGL